MVNTKGNETTPFITKENILYFSSDGLEGQGELDVFAVEIYDNATSEPYELASPINSINDDFAYIVNKDNNLGFFTSNRLQGDGFNDLYSFTLDEDFRPGECFITVDGKVRDKESYEAISGATVDLYSIDGSLLESVSTYNDGAYQFTVSCAKEYELIASNPDYLDDKKRIEILEENYHSALHTNLNLTKVEKKTPTVKRLSPVYYEFDDANITQEAAEEMNKIAEIMTENENLIIEASSFTDSRGSNAYNVELSKRRAKAAVEYLKSKGIDEDRIRSKGYGEDKLINQCVNGAECKEEAHQMNRRTEFNFANVPADSSKKKSGTAKTTMAIQTKKTVSPVLTKPQEAKKTSVVNKVELSEVKKSPSVAKLDQAIKPAPLKEEQSIESASNKTVKIAATDHQIIAPIVYKKSVKSAPVVQAETKVIETPEVALQESFKEKQTVSKEIIENKSELKEVNNGKIEEKQVVVASEEKEKTNKKEVKEAVIINYNSTIVATNPESNKVLNYIGSEKVKMIEQLSDLEKQYNDAIPIYPKLSDSLKVEKGRIADVILGAKEMEETGWSNIIEYKNNVLHFKKRYRALMVTNSRNTVSGSLTREERQVAHASKQAEPNTIAEAEKPKVAEMEENLSVNNVEITAMKKNGNGKYQKTNSASKTDLIKVTFKLISNQKVDSGRKEAHLVLQNPEGNVEEAKGIFTLKNSETESKYTDHAIINYNNHDVDVTMFIQRKGSNFEKGIYPVKVFLEGELMTVTKLNLSNSF